MRPAGSAPTIRRTPTASWASPGPGRTASTSASSTCTRPSRCRMARRAGRAARADAPRSWRSICPSPMVVFDGERYSWDYDRPDSIGKIRSFHGNMQAVLRSYAWVLAHGAEGLRAGGRNRGAEQQLPASDCCSRSRVSRSRTTPRVTGCRRCAIAGSRCSKKLGSARRMCGGGWSTSACRAISPATTRCWCRSRSRWSRPKPGQKRSGGVRRPC